jgi:hypothetical protein
LRRRAVVVTAAITAALFVLLLVGLVAAALDDGGPEEATVLQLAAYEKAVVDTAKQGGQSVELGLKVAIGDLGSEHRTAPAVIAEQAVAWRADLVRARDVFDDTDPPPGLDSMRRDFVASLGAYVAAADLVREAALAPEAARDALLDRAVEAGRRGDRLYDRASRTLQDARRRAGLPPSPEFPDR